MKKAPLLVIAGTVVLSAAAQPALAGPSQSGVSVAFAKVSTNDGTLRAFGGKGTKSAVGAVDGTGRTAVTFTGKYPKNIAADKLILQSTCQSNNFEASNAVVDSASPTQIVVTLYCWTTDTLAFTGDDAFVNVFVGQ